MFTTKCLFDFELLVDTILTRILAPNCVWCIINPKNGHHLIVSFFAGHFL